MDRQGTSADHQAIVVGGAEGSRRGKRKASASMAPARGRGRGRGQGTGRGRGRGRPPTPRTIRAPPETLYSIIVRIGGRWKTNQRPGFRGLMYKGGCKHYIHCVDPVSFSVTQLFYAAMKMNQDKNLPTRFWYHEHGQEYPNGLVVIQDDDDLDEMWFNVRSTFAKAAVVFIQDVEKVISNDPSVEGYELPAEVPRVNENFVPDEIYERATLYEHAEESRNPYENWLDEEGGQEWYVSSESAGRVVGV